MHRFTILSSVAGFLTDWDQGNYRACKLAYILFTRELQVGGTLRMRSVTDQRIATLEDGAVQPTRWAMTTRAGLQRTVRLQHAQVHQGTDVVRSLRAARKSAK